MAPLTTPPLAPPPPYAPSTPSAHNPPLATTPLLLDLLQHTLGPAPVGSVIETHTGVRAIILRAFIDDQRWLLHALPLNHPQNPL